jgi:hypothetical protein
MAVVQLEAIAAVYGDVPLLVVNLKVDLGVDAGYLALGTKVDVHAPVLAVGVTMR